MKSLASGRSPQSYLREVIQIITEEPRRLDMEDWLQTGLTGAAAPPCGTVGCIAGWVCEIHRDEGYNRGLHDSFSTVAGAVLGLAGTEYASELFYTYCWPEKFQKRLAAEVRGTAGYARVVASRIRAFIKERYAS